MKRHFAHHEHEPAVFLEYDVGGADEEIVGDAVGDSGHGMNGARGDDHAVGLKTAAGEGGADFFDGVGVVGEFSKSGQAEPHFQPSGPFGRACHDQVGFDAFGFAQLFEKAISQDGAAGAGNAYDDSQWGIPPRNLGFNFHNQNKLIR